MQGSPPRPTIPLPPPPPMADVRIAHSAIADLAKAVDRAGNAWNRAQMRDALRSVRYWLEWAEKAIEEPKAVDDPHPRPQAQP